MTRINLLPWRETHRIKKNNEFYVTLGICLLLAAGVGLGGYKFAEGKVSFQNSRNDLLNREITLLDKQLQEIKGLEKTKSDLLARMTIIQQLQAQRPQIVHTFFEVASRIPDGIYLTNVKQNEQQRMVLEGKAESNARVSSLMRRMDRSDYFKDPKLEVIETDKSDGISSFTLGLTQDRPKTEEESNDGI